MPIISTVAVDRILRDAALEAIELSFQPNVEIDELVVAWNSDTPRGTKRADDVVTESPVGRERGMRFE